MLKKIFILNLILISTLSISGQNQRKIAARDTITDKNIIVPEEIERNFAQLLTDWKKSMKPSSSCNSYYGNNISYADSTYINRLYSLPTEMELVYNPIVRSYIDMYTGRMRNSVEFFLGKSYYYFPIFEQALDKAGLPIELKYLPIIESALNPVVVSRAGATGLWQFMIGTGKMYDLEINSLVDERRDPLKSTNAAVRYLKDLYNIYGDWNLVIAAYNCGPGNVNKAIRRSGGKTDYWEIYQYLPRETRGYVPAFIAATYVMNYYTYHNICPAEYNYHYSTDTIHINKYLHLQQLSDVLNIPLEEVREMNPQFKKDIVPGDFKQYLVTLPSALTVDFESRKDSIYSYRSNELLAHRKVVNPGGVETTTNRVRHKVKRGETLSKIASQHKVTVKQIKTWNRLKSNNLRIGQVLSIHKSTPVKNSSEPTQYYANNITKTPSSSVKAETKAEVTPENNESSNTLSEYFNRRTATPPPTKDNTVVEIDSNISTEIASADEILSSDEQGATYPIDMNEVRIIYHKVRIGETLTQIANKYNVKTDDILTWNKMSKKVPKVGERLAIYLPENTAKEQVVNNEAETTLLAENFNDTNSGFEQYRESKSIATLPPPTPEENKPKAKKKPVKKQPVTYTVKKGDTLSHIVGKFGGNLTPKDIMKANKLRSDRLKIGQKLKIPR